MKGIEPKKTFLALPLEKQRRILEIAATEFALKGFQGASLNYIVERLGIAKGSLYQYFHDKQHLFLCAFDYGIRLAKDALKEIESKEVSVFEQIRSSLLAGFRFVQKHPLVYQTYLKILFENKVPLREKLISTLRLYSHKYLLPLLEKGQKKGEIRPDIDLEMAAFMLDAMMERFLQAHTLDYMDSIGIYKADDKTIVRTVDSWIEILKKGLS
jgi:TetR/AcrR family transcriptional regulator